MKGEKARKANRGLQAAPPGPEGKEGHEGKGPRTIILRARSVGSVVTSARPSNQSDPLEEGSWVQTADELDEFAGQVTHTTPSTASCSRPESEQAFGEVNVELDGKLVGQASFFAENAMHSGAIEFEPANHDPNSVGLGQGWLFEPGKETTHNLLARVYENCGEGGGHATGHFTVDSIAVDVIGVR